MEETEGEDEEQGQEDGDEMTVGGIFSSDCKGF